MAGMAKDYYRILGLARDATPVEIKKTYRRLALQVHPDVNREDPGSEEHFREITEAYGVLVDPLKREKYDRGQHSDFAREEVFRDVFTHADFHDVFDDLPVKREWLERLFDIGRVIAYEALIYGGSPKEVLKRSIVRFAAQGASKMFHHVMDMHEHIAISQDIASHGGYITIEYRPGFRMSRIRVRIPPGTKSGTVLRIAGMGRKNFRKKAGDLYLHMDISSL